MMERSKAVLRTILLLALIILLIVGCSGGTEPTELKLDAKEEISDNNQVKVYLETNLPDETVIMVSLSNEEIGYNGQDEISIANGKGETDWFSNKGSKLANGEYVLNITVPITNAQPDSVKEIVGEDYKNLISDYIVEGEIGTTIEISKEIKITNSDVNKESIEEKYARDKEIVKNLYDQLMEEYKNQKESYDKLEWGIFSNTWNKEIDEKSKLLENSKADCKIAIGDLYSLWQEVNNELEGKEADVQFFINSIKEYIID